MANKPDVHYVNRYVSGPAAPKLVPQTTPKKNPRLPRPRTRANQEMLLRVDPFAVVGVVVAVVLLVLMIVGVSRLNTRQEQLAANTQYIENLQAENAELQELYQSGYDLEEIERIAQALGMVPKDTLVHESIQVTTPVPVEQPSRWENFWNFVTGLFA